MTTTRKRASHLKKEVRAGAGLRREVCRVKKDVQREVGYILAVDSKQPKAKRVALLWPSGHLDRCPPVLNLATALAKRGYEVTIFSARSRVSPEPRMSEPGVGIEFMPGVQQEFREPVVRMTFRFLRWVSPKIAGGVFGCVIGVGIRGLMVAARLKKSGMRVGYHSLELYPTEEARSIAQKCFKALERRAHRKMDFTIAQDAMRAELLAKYNGVSSQGMALLPVSPLGPGEVKRSTYLHERLGIAADRKIVLYAGTVDAPFSVANELIAESERWPAEYVLVVHSNAIVQVPPKQSRAVFSAEPVLYADIDKLISSAHVGLAMYKPSDDNMKYIGLSSGKMSEYLRYGVPVIASDLPIMGELVRETSCGVAVADVSEVGAALQTIAADYAAYCGRAVNCFDKKLAQENYIEGVIAAIES